MIIGLRGCEKKEDRKFYRIYYRKFKEIKRDGVYGFK